MFLEDSIVYLDNASTTKVINESVDIACQMMTKTFANPSSNHVMGNDSEIYLRNATRNIEKLLGLSENTLYFTSGATESNNWALFGAAKAYKQSGKHIITTKLEHDSVLNPIKVLEKDGFDISYINNDYMGRLCYDSLADLINKDTIIVSVMHVNNELGIINNIAKIGSIIKQINPKTLFHVDASASFTKIPINTIESKIDLLTLSGHKIHAPKGVGALYIKNGVRLEPIFYGGGQQKNFRSGTENVPGITAFATAARIMHNNLQVNYNNVLHLKTYMWNALKELFPAIQLIGSLEQSSPYILSVSFTKLKSMVIMTALQELNIIVSAGSACHSRKNRTSTALAGLGLDNTLTEGIIRFSFSFETTKQEIDICINHLKEIIPKLGF